MAPIVIVSDRGPLMAAVALVQAFLYHFQLFWQRTDVTEVLFNFCTKIYGFFNFLYDISALIDIA